MNPISRTPEGEPNQCPICGHEVRMEPSRPPGDAPCPYCGHLLWFAAPEGPKSPRQQIVMDQFEFWTLMVAQAPDDQYFQKLVSELVKLMAAKAGAVWIRRGKVLELKCRHEDPSMSESSPEKERHDVLLRQVVASGESAISPSLARELPDGRLVMVTGENAINSPPVGGEMNENLLLAVPVKQNREIKAIVEIVQLPGASVEVQQDNLRSLERICTLASERICRLATVGEAPEVQVAGVSSTTVAKKRWWQAWKK